MWWTGGGNVNDVTQAHASVHGKDADMIVDAGYAGIDGRRKVQTLKMRWIVAFQRDFAAFAPLRRCAADSERPNEF